MVNNGKNGFIVPPRAPEAIGAAMRRLVEERGLAESMGVASRRIAEDEFDVCKVSRIICSAMGL